MPKRHSADPLRGTKGFEEVKGGAQGGLRRLRQAENQGSRKRHRRFRRKESGLDPKMSERPSTNVYSVGEWS